MTGKRYSAGAIFLQVVPVFANVQRAIEDEAKNIDRALGDSMEKSGKKAGERAGKAASKSMNDEIEKGSRELSGSFERNFHKSVDEVNKALGGIDIKRLSNDMRREVTAMKKELSGLKDVDITAEADFKRVYAELAVLEGRLLGFRDGAKIVFRSDIDNALKGIAKIKAAKESIDDPVDIEVRMDTKPAERAMSLFEKRLKKAADKAGEALESSLDEHIKEIGKDLKQLGDLRIGVDISAEAARAELKGIAAELARINKDDVDVDVAVETGAALAELAAFEKALDAIDKRHVDVDVDAKKAKAGAEDAANSFRSFNIVLLAAVSIGPALIPILAGIAGGLLALGPAAAVGAFGLGAVLVGFSGLGDALSALQSQQDQAATNAQTNAGRQVSAARAIEAAQEALSDARRNAARAAEDAAERVADAREQAADAIEDALERQKDAQEEYRDAVQEVKDAEQDLRDAREEARKDAESLAKRQRQNAVDERQALLDLAEAQNDFNNVMADGSSTDTDKEQAAVNLEQAQIALNDTRDEQVALADEAADYAKNGVDGSEKVKSAQEELTDALEAQKDAQDDVKEAAEAADEARIDGAKAVQDALEDQREVLSDNARAIDRAKEALHDARQSAEQDLSAINSQQQAVNAAFDKLGPAGRKFVLFLFSLKSGFYEFRDDVQKVLLPAVQDAIESFIGSENAGKARNFMIVLAEGFGKFVKALSQSFQGPAWGAFFETMAEAGPKIQKAYGNAFISVMEAFASILTIAAPFAVRFARGLEKMMDAFADWASSKEGADAIKDFIGYAEKVGPKVIDFFFGLVDAVINLAKGLAPYSEVVLGLIDGFLEFIAEMDPKTLGAIATAMSVILLASQVAYGVMNLTMSLGALFATTIGPWVFLAVAMGAALVYLYQTNEDFKKFIDDAWPKIAKTIKKAWEEDIKPALGELWDALKELWKEVLQPFLEWFGPILLWFIEKLIPAFADVIGQKLRLAAKFIHVFIGVGKRMVQDVKDIVGTIRKWWGIAADGVKWLKDRFVAGFKDMKDSWASVGTKVKDVWNEHIAPIWDHIKNDALPALKTAFNNTIGAIGDLWDGLKKLVATPIKFVIEKVINDGLIAGFNKVSGWVNGPKIDPLTVPESLQSYATGGIMPGYTPGRDPHKFYSPTAGQLELSGGEAVMRPEWTAAVGADTVNQWNAIARTKGVSGLRKAMGMGSYWLGGVLPLPGARTAMHTSGYSHPAFDLNVGSGYDDYGMAVKAWKEGIARLQYLGDTSYGRYVTIDHGDQTSLYAHLSNYAKGLTNGMRVAAGQTIGYVGDIGNTGTPPTSHLHFEIMGGSPDWFDVGGEDAPTHRAIPSWLMGVIKDPLGSVKSWITDPIKDAAASVAGSELFNTVSKVPLKLGKAVTDKVWDVIPGWAKTAAGWAGNAADWTIGGVKSIGEAAGDVVGGVKNGAEAVSDWLGFNRGGILPYNGAMMYDSGGYLQPGLTTVMNLTGKPEPVFTDGQFRDLNVGGSDGFTYAPTINGSNLTAADLVDDLDFTRRKIRREGKYGRNQS